MSGVRLLFTAGAVLLFVLIGLLNLVWRVRRDPPVEAPVDTVGAALTESWRYRRPEFVALLFLAIVAGGTVGYHAVDVFELE